MADLRHLAMMYVSIDVVPTMLCTGRVTRCIEGIPPDARAVTIFEDLARNAVGFVFEHPSFPVHHPGEVMYALRPAQLQIVEDGA
jgi:hypothetical protein